MCAWIYFSCVHVFTYIIRCNTDCVTYVKIDWVSQCRVVNGLRLH